MKESKRKLQLHNTQHNILLWFKMTSFLDMFGDLNLKKLIKINKQKLHKQFCASSFLVGKSQKQYHSTLKTLKMPFQNTKIFLSPSLYLSLCWGFHLYQGSVSEIVIPGEQLSCSLLGKFVCTENAICFGVGNDIILLVSIEITSDMVGLFVANSCMHKRPTWIISKSGAQNRIQPELNPLAQNFYILSIIPKLATSKCPTIYFPVQSKKINMRFSLLILLTSWGLQDDKCH